MKYFKAHSLQFLANANPTAVVLPTTTARQWSNNPTIDNEVTASSVSPTFIAMMARDIEATMSGYALTDLFNILGTRGFCIENTPVTKPGVTWFQQQFDECGEPVAGAVQRSFTVSDGRAVPVSLEVDHQGNAVLSYRIIPITMGTLDILILDKVATLPTIAIQSARFAIGPLEIGGVDLDGYTSLSLDFGNDVQARSTKSDIDNTLINQATNSPVLTVRGIDSTWWDTVMTLAGVNLTHLNTIFYLRKRQQGSPDFVLDATPEHIRFTMHGLGALNDLAAGGVINDPSEMSLTLTGAEDLAGIAPLTVATDVAIV